MPTVSGPPHPEGRIVEAASFPSRFEADVAARTLVESGIHAIVDPGDASGWMPNLATYRGVRVLVFDHDLDHARALLDDAARPDDPGAG